MSNATTAEFQTTLPAASEREPALPFRGDTILGVCEAVGQDLGFHPNWLRIPFGALLLWNTMAVIGAYLGLGCIVALARWFYPAERPNAAPKLVSETQAPAEQNDEDLAIAA
ncbi:MAG: PspC domain-containing protein [Sphingomicrobium sp.]